MLGSNIRDLITIGAEISRKCKVNAQSEEFKQIGKNFVEFLHSDDMHTLAKMLVAQHGLTMADLAQFACTHSSFKNSTLVSDALKITTADASACIRIFHNVKNQLIERRKELSFFELDASGHYNDFIVLDDLESFAPGSGAALIRSLQRKVTIPIILQAGFLHCGDYEHFRTTNDFSVVDHLVHYYQELGFKDVNDKIGQYEESVIMVWEENNSWISQQESLNVF